MNKFNRQTQIEMRIREMKRKILHCDLGLKKIYSEHIEFLQLELNK